jgi:hypothetical protein
MAEHDVAGLRLGRNLLVRRQNVVVGGARVLPVVLFMALEESETVRSDNKNQIRSIAPSAYHQDGDVAVFEAMYLLDVVHHVLNIILASRELA